MFDKTLKFVLIHGNGGATSKDNWFPSLTQWLLDKGLKVDARDFPDSQIAHESVWISYLKNHIKVDPKTILIGHSSGAVAALRYAEKYNIYASVLVGVNYTDLGDETEKQSGYYNHPWNWDKIRSNQNWILQFASIDDPYIPITEPRYIHEQLKTEYHEYKNKGHFMIPEFPELIEALTVKLLA